MIIWQLIFDRLEELVKSLVNLTASKGTMIKHLLDHFVQLWLTLPHLIVHVIDAEVLLLELIILKSVGAIWRRDNLLEEELV